MSDDPRNPAPQSQSADRPTTDSEISTRAVVMFTVGIAVIMAAAIVGMYFFSLELRDREIANDPPPPVLAAARQRFEPPEPRLQSDPVADIEALHAAEEAELSTWAWVDEARGIAQIPIEEAMDVLMAHGFDAAGSTADPSAEAPPTAPPTAEGEGESAAP